MLAIFFRVADPWFFSKTAYINKDALFLYATEVSMNFGIVIHNRSFRSCDHRIDDAREELHKMINDEELKDAVVLVYANK